jgi:hypothetical protein
MLDWSSRIDDLALHLAQYRMEDRGALESLLSALVPTPRTSTLWFVLETNWFSRDCQRAWFSFGEDWQPASLPLLRTSAPATPTNSSPAGSMTGLDRTSCSSNAFRRTYPPLPHALR